MPRPPSTLPAPATFTAAAIASADFLPLCRLFVTATPLAAAIVSALASSASVSQPIRRDRTPRFASPLTAA